MGSVYVTNTNDFSHEDRYDGEDYVFPPNQKVLVPDLAATHMLGFNLKDKTETLVRLGWATKYDPVSKRFSENEEGVRKLSRFVFEEAVMVARSLLSPPVVEPPIA